MPKILAPITLRFIEDVLRSAEARIDRWTYQGFGMLRYYLPGPGNYRIHVWNPDGEVEKVSKIHTHPWDLESLIICGRLGNQRWTEGEGDHYLKQSLVCGASGCLFGSAELVRLHPRPWEDYYMGDTYFQRRDEIHSSHPQPGCVTLTQRTIPAGVSADLAYVYYPEGQEWVSAEPRQATLDEVKTWMAMALEQFSIDWPRNSPR